MSEIKNDPGGKKQILVSIISSLTAIILLYLSTTGASLRCTEEGNCEIHRKNFLTDSLDKFNWKEVKAVQYTPSGKIIFSISNFDFPNFF